jgi:3D (Asp-Asp-Asp) domain-containing protein
MLSTATTVYIKLYGLLIIFDVDERIQNNIISAYNFDNWL